MNKLLKLLALRFSLFAILLTIHSSLFTIHCFAQDSILSLKQKKLIIINPTKENVKSFVSLFKKKLLNTDSLIIIGLYNTSQDYNFNKSKEYLANIQQSNFYLLGFNFDIPYDSVFTTNHLSSTFNKLFKNTNGIIFTGGEDIPPFLYNEKCSLLSETLPISRIYEISFLFHLVGELKNSSSIPFLNTKPDYLIFGICLGMQMLNVACGGSLYQDIPKDVYKFDNVNDLLADTSIVQHHNYYKQVYNLPDLISFSLHQITLTKEFYTFFNAETLHATSLHDYKPVVISAHHQCINRLGENLGVLAYNNDKKVIEGIYHKKFRHVYGFQFHPESINQLDTKSVLKITPTKIIPVSMYKNPQNNLFYKLIWNYIPETISKRIDN